MGKECRNSEAMRRGSKKMLKNKKAMQKMVEKKSQRDLLERLDKQLKTRKDEDSTMAGSRPISDVKCKRKLIDSHEKQSSTSSDEDSTTAYPIVQVTEKKSKHQLLDNLEKQLFSKDESIDMACSQSAHTNGVR